MEKPIDIAFRPTYTPDGEWLAAHYVPGFLYDMGDRLVPAPIGWLAAETRYRERLERARYERGECCGCVGDNGACRGGPRNHLRAFRGSALCPWSDQAQQQEREEINAAFRRWAEYLLEEEN